MKTMRKVMIVVAVLMTSCHVSEKWYRGPTAAHPTMAAQATKNISADPTTSELQRANLRKRSCIASSLHPLMCLQQELCQNFPRDGASAASSTGVSGSPDSSTTGGDGATIRERGTAPSMTPA